ncbi:MAG TPA: hypothetical protein PK711_03700 [Bacteroidales bacterium]|nr:hypothetical protein [Bacteroidales bacterium]HRZ20533.1 hypothetical protein [Bacteroidales bacterium]
MIHYRYKIPGLILILLGIGLTILYSVHRMNLQVPVFAIHSSYLVTKYFTVIKTNIFEEIIFLSYFAGFLLTAFSRERVEHEAYSTMRAIAWQKAILINALLLVLCTLFVFGRGFLAVLIFNMFSVFILYHIIFYVKKRRFGGNQDQ